MLRTHDPAAWNPPAACQSLTRMQCLTMPRGGDCNGKVYSALDAFLKAAPSATLNFELEPPRMRDGTELAEQFESIVCRWMELTSSQVNQEIGVARMAIRNRKASAEQLYIVTSCRELMKESSDRRHLLGQMRVLLTHPSIPYLEDDLQNLTAVVAHSFDPNSGRLLTWNLQSFLASGEYCRRALVLLGDSNNAKTAYLKCAARFCTHAAHQAAEQQYFIMTSTLDALYNARFLLVEGTAILFDEFVPRTAAGGRNKYLTSEDLKGTCTVFEATTLSTRCGDTNLPAGSRFFSTNQEKLSHWWPSLIDGFQFLSDEERCSIDADTKSLYKRMAFAFVNVPLVPPEKMQEFWDDILQDGAERMEAFFRAFAKRPRAE